jgi:hypothetical protein
MIIKRMLLAQILLGIFIADEVADGTRCWPALNLYFDLVRMGCFAVFIGFCLEKKQSN